MTVRSNLPSISRTSSSFSSRSTSRARNIARGDTVRGDTPQSARFVRAEWSQGPPVHTTLRAKS